jgi:methionyl-tRNA formyltransferase
VKQCNGASLKIIFAGTPQFAASALQALLTNKFEVVAVLTQPDRPAGRGMQLLASPVKQLALQFGIPVLQPVSLKTAEIQQELAALHADVMVVAAYGLILPLAVLNMFKHGCLNIHASLLPRWRGAAPIQRAILAGDAETGVTIMQMDVGLDTGNMLLKQSCRIEPEETSHTLHDKLAVLGAEAIVSVLNDLQKLSPVGQVQDADFATYAQKIVKSEAALDWGLTAQQLALAVRAYNPVPVAYTLLNGTAIKIWQASVSAGNAGEAGSVVMIDKKGIHVACGKDALCLEVLQRPGGKALPAPQFIQGLSVKVGDRFSKP